ncbi:HGGxSTG domain-containing protein [Citrobacter freundii]
MTCGAKTRKGTPCKLTSLYGSGRCKLHGGHEHWSKNAGR